MNIKCPRMPFFLPWRHEMATFSKVAILGQKLGDTGYQLSGNTAYCPEFHISHCHPRNLLYSNINQLTFPFTQIWFIVKDNKTMIFFIITLRWHYCARCLWRFRVPGSFDHNDSYSHQEVKKNIHKYTKTLPSIYYINLSHKNIF